MPPVPQFPVCTCSRWAGGTRLRGVSGCRCGQCQIMPPLGDTLQLPTPAKSVYSPAPSPLKSRGRRGMGLGYAWSWRDPGCTSVTPRMRPGCLGSMGLTDSRWKSGLGSNSSHLVQASHSGCLGLRPLACKTRDANRPQGPEEGAGHAQDALTHTLLGM